MNTRQSHFTKENKVHLGRKGAQPKRKLTYAGVGIFGLLFDTSPAAVGLEVGRGRCFFVMARNEALLIQRTGSETQEVTILTTSLASLA